LARNSDRFSPLPEEVNYLLQIVAIRSLCRRRNVERIEVGPTAAVLSFRDNIFSNPEGLIRSIGKHPEGARVRPDMKVVFFDKRHGPKGPPKAPPVSCACSSRLRRRTRGQHESYDN
jgi:transcription-repair coupling factor (superfamily II helicase)